MNLHKYDCHALIMTLTLTHIQVPAHSVLLKHSKKERSSSYYERDFTYESTVIKMGLQHSLI